MTHSSEHAEVETSEEGPILACVSSSPLSGVVVRRSHRLAEQLDRSCRAVYVETPSAHAESNPDAGRARDHLRIADNLGATTDILQGKSVAQTLADEAERLDASILVVGKPTRSRWRDLVGASLVDRISKATKNAEILIVSDPSENQVPEDSRGTTAAETSFEHVLAAVAVVGIATAVGLGIRGWVTDTDIVMVFLLGVMLIAYRMPRLPALASALLSVAAYDFFFVLPYHTFAVYNVGSLLTFAVMATVGLAISGLTSRVKGQAEAARRREKSTRALYTLGQELARQTAPDELLEAAVDHVADVFDSDAAVVDVDPSGALVVEASSGDLPDLELDDAPIRAALEEGEPAGAADAGFTGAQCYYVPIQGVNEEFGLLAVAPSEPLEFSDPERRDLVEAHADQIGLFLERLRLSEEARQTQVELETERVRNAILSSVSHDLRTPLGTMMGAASTLYDADDQLDSESRSQLAETIFEESRRLDRRLDNLLEMTRVENDELSVEPEWQAPGEVVGSALSQLEPELTDREVDVELPSPEQLAHFDGPLVEQVLVNLLENAIRHTDAPIEVGAHIAASGARFQVRDHGVGVPLEERDRLVEKFEQGDSGSDRGSGLGLAIAHAIVRAHGGELVIRAPDNGSGTAVVFDLPHPETAPPEVPDVASVDSSDTS